MQITEAASRSIRASIDELVADAVDRQWRRWPDLRARLNQSQREQTINDTRFHLQFIASSLWAAEPLLLGDYLRWCKVLFTNLSLPIEWLVGSIECVRESLAQTLSAAELAVAEEYIDSAMETLQSSSTTLESVISADAPLGGLAHRYLGAVLGGDRVLASQMLTDVADEGTSIRDIYLHVFQPVQREIGRLWLMNRISVAQEHYATSVTQVVMAQLYGRMFTGERHNRSLVAACVGRELHELGMRMVADFFEMDRWDTRYLGANMPNASIVQTVRESRADMLALSATMLFHVEEVAKIIEMVRADEATARTKVLVGGYPFNLAPDLWHRVGADGYAPDAESALVIGRELLTV